MIKKQMVEPHQKGGCRCKTLIDGCSIVRRIRMNKILVTCATNAVQPPLPCAPDQNYTIVLTANLSYPDLAAVVAGLQEVILK